MRRLLPLLTLSLCLAGSVAADCSNPQSQAEMTDCAYLSWQREDAALNATWKRVRATLQATEAEYRREGWFDATLDGQRGWLAYRDGQCVAEGYEARGGTMEGMIVVYCKARLTRGRIRELLALVGATTVDYRMERHPLSGVALPRVALPGRAAVEQEVNRSLEAIGAELRCDSEGEYHAAVEVTHAYDDVLSVSIRGSGFCGDRPIIGADLSASYDLVTGRRIGFRELFEDHGRDRAKIAAAYVASLEPEALEGCEEELSYGEGTSEEEVAALEMYGFHYTLAPQGVALQPAFPRVIFACAAEALVPYERLRPFAAEGSILSRLAELWP